MTSKLFEAFPPISTERWMETVLKDLKGADFDKKLVTTTLDGIKLRPFYRSEDLPPEIGGELRAYRRDGNTWILREEVREPDVAAANKHALYCLGRGAQQLAVHTYPIGPRIESQEEMQRFLDGIWIDAAPIHWIGGPLAPQALAMLVNEAARRGITPDRLQGSVDLDPILDRCAGWVDAPVTEWKDDLLEVSRYILENLPGYGLLVIRGALIEKAGASLAQEIAFSLSLFTEYLSAYQDAIASGALKVPGAATNEAALAAIVSRSEVQFGVGTNYFLEIAKLRAARVVLRNVLDAFGVSGVHPRIHAITTSSSKTLFDPHNNLLRATIESMSAVMAGVDSLTVAAYDQGYHTPDEFSEHLARNTETLLNSEAYLSRVADPLGGSYTVEALTHSLAEKAWELFRKVEEAGGFTAAWEAGLISEELNRTRAARIKQVSSRRRTIVGTSVYPNINEQRLPDIQLTAPTLKVKARPAGQTIEALAESLARGAKLGEWITAEKAPSTALDPFRPSWPFEHLRLRVERHAATGGKRPLILLAMIGDPAMRRARSGFCQGFLGAGGYDVREGVFDSMKAAEDAAADQKADALVLCSSDPEYPALAQEIKTQIPVLVAGYPQDSIEELKASGVSDFIHVRLNITETLASYHVKFGIPEIPVDEPLKPETK